MIFARAPLAAGDVWQRRRAVERIGNPFHFLVDPTARVGPGLMMVSLMEDGIQGVHMQFNFNPSAFFRDIRVKTREGLVVPCAMIARSSILNAVIAIPE